MVTHTFVYMFHLYIYTYLYCIATIGNTCSTYSHLHHHLTIAQWMGMGSKWWQMSFGPQVSFISSILLTFLLVSRYDIYDNEVMASSPHPNWIPPLQASAHRVANGPTTPMQSPQQQTTPMPTTRMTTPTRMTATRQRQERAGGTMNDNNEGPR